MPDEVVLKFNAQLNTAQAEEKIAFMEARLAKAASSALRVGDLDFKTSSAILNKMTPTEVAQLRGQSPGLDRELKSWSQFAATGKTDEDRKQEATLLRQQVLQRKQDLQLQQQLQQQHSKNLQLAQQQYQSGMRVVSMLTNLAMGNTSAVIRAGVFNVASTAMAAGAGQAAAGATAATGGASGAAGAAGGGGTNLTPAALAAVAPRLLSLVGGAGAAGLMATLAVAAGAAAINSGTSSLAKTQEAYLANIGGSTDTVQAVMERARRTSGGYQEDLGTTSQLYELLGRAGVGPTNVEGTANAAAAASRVFGLPLQQTGAMAGILATAGQMNPDEIAQTFDAVARGSAAVGLSMNRLVDTMTSFSRATGQTALSLAGQESLLALQGFVGPTVDVGKAAAPLAGATGVQAFKLAGVLGITPEQLQTEQTGGNAGISRLFSQYGAFLKRAIGGLSPTSARAVDIAEAINQQVGGFDTTGMGMTEQSHLFQLAMSNPQAAVQYYQKFQQTIGTPNAGAFRAQGQAQGGAQESWLSKLHNLISTETDRILGDISSATSKVADAVTNNPAASAAAIGGIPLALLEPSMVMGAGIAAAAAKAILGTAHGGNATGLSYSIDPSGKGGGAQPGGIAPGIAGPTGPVKGASVNGKTVPPAYLAAYVQASKATGIPLEILLAQGMAESGFNPNAVSSAGAQGIAQFMPATWASYQKDPKSPIYGSKATPFDPAAAIATQAYMDAQLLKQYGNLTDALDVYNEGPGNFAKGARYGQAYANNIQQAAQTQVIVQIDNSAAPGVHSTVTTTQQNVPQRPAAGQRTPVHIVPPRLPNLLPWG